MPAAHASDEGDARISRKDLEKPGYNSGANQERVWIASGFKDRYTGWHYERFHEAGAPWHVDHIIELQMIGNAAETCAHTARGVETRGLLKRQVAAMLRDHVVNEPTRNLNITCEKINLFKGKVITGLMKAPDAVDFAEAVDECNISYKTCDGGRKIFMDSPVAAAMIRSEGSAREATDAIVERIRKASTAAMKALRDAASPGARGAAGPILATMGAAERGYAAKVLDALEASLSDMNLVDD